MSVNAQEDVFTLWGCNLGTIHIVRVLIVPFFVMNRETPVAHFVTGQNYFAIVLGHFCYGAFLACFL